MLQQKIFIIGLPRTANTSVCHAMLKLGLKTAHTAYTREAMEQAQVIADTPVFCDYPKLAELYPSAKFIYLTRDLSLWLPSIRQLLSRMYDNLQRPDGGFNPIIKRCYNQVFFPLTRENIASDTFLQECYRRHREAVLDFFSDRPQELLTLDVNMPKGYSLLRDFLSLDSCYLTEQRFEVMNIGGKVTAWNQIRHPLKIASTRAGKVDKIWY